MHIKKACNFVSTVVFDTKNLSQASLHKVTYQTLRSDYAMRSQMAQSVMMLEYKAALHEAKVIAVDPKHISQACPKCGHTEKANRNKKKHMFCCKTCGYTSNDDRIGAAFAPLESYKLPLLQVGVVD